MPDYGLDDTTPRVAVVTLFQLPPFTLPVGELAPELTVGETYVFTLDLPGQLIRRDRGGFPGLFRGRCRVGLGGGQPVLESLGKGEVLPVTWEGQTPREMEESGIQMVSVTVRPRGSSGPPAPCRTPDPPGNGPRRSGRCTAARCCRTAPWWG
mgnify:CR=1 FL=1